MCGEQVSSPISASVRVARPMLEVLLPTALIRAATPTQGGYTPYVPFTGEKIHMPVRPESLGVKRKELSYLKDKHCYPELPTRRKVNLIFPFLVEEAKTQRHRMTHQPH